MLEIIEKFVKAKRASTEARVEISACLSTSGLSVEQVLILSAIREQPLQISDIAYRCAMHVPSVSRSLADLEAASADIFTRIPGETDQRKVSIKITAHGKKLLARVYESHEAKKA